MKKKLFSVLLSVCFVFSSIAVLTVGSACKSEPPATAVEYVQWLLNRMESAYSVSGRLQYKKDENYSYTAEELKNVNTEVTANVTKKGNTKIATVQKATYDYNLDNQNALIGTAKAEFTKSGKKYSMQVFDDSKKVAKSVALSEQEYLIETCNMLLPDALLSLIVKKSSDINTEIDMLEGFYPKEGADGEYELVEGEGYKLIVYSGELYYENSDDYKYVGLGVLVYKNKLQGIYYNESGRLNDKRYSREGYLNYKSSQNPAEPFSKEGYYASEEECAKAVLEGVFEALPTRYRVTTMVSTTVDSTTLSAVATKVAYEKIGDTEYFYLYPNDGQRWEIQESYTQNGNGHIGRIYDNKAFTYKEKVCESDLCLNDTENLQDEHVWINGTNTSFKSMARVLDELGNVEAVEVQFDKNGVCTITLTLPDSGDGTHNKVIYVVEGKVLISFTTETTIDSMPDMSGLPGLPDLTGKTVIEKTISTYNYDVSLINADLSIYTKAQ